MKENSKTQLFKGRLDKLLFTPHDISEILGIKRSKTYQLLNSGQIRTIKLGDRCVRVHRDDLSDYIDHLRDQDRNG